LNAMLSQAYLHAGLLREGLAANDAAVAAIEAQSRPTADGALGFNVNTVYGFDVPKWILCLRVRILVLLGHFEEAEATLARVLQVSPGEIYPVVQSVAHMGAVDLAWHRGDAAMAKSHANEIANYAAQSGMPYLLTVTVGYRGLAQFAEGDFTSAADCFREALATARRSRAGLEIEAKLMAFLAHALDRAGDHARATEVAAEAILVGQRRTDHLAELHANIVAAHALSASDEAGRRSAAEEHLGRAQELLDMTGAAIFLPLLRQAVANLTRQKRSAHE